MSEIIRCDFREHSKLTRALADLDRLPESDATGRVELCERDGELLVVLHDEPSGDPVVVLAAYDFTALWKHYQQRKARRARIELRIKQHECPHPSRLLSGGKCRACGKRV